MGLVLAGAATGTEPDTPVRIGVWPVWAYALAVGVIVLVGVVIGKWVIPWWFRDTSTSSEDEAEARDREETPLLGDDGGQVLTPAARHRWRLGSRASESLEPRRISEYRGGSGHYMTLTDPGLRKNIATENLRLRKNSMFSYTVSNHGHEKMFNYDTDRALGWDAIFNLTGTCLADWKLWRVCSVYWVITGLVAWCEVRRITRNIGLDSEHVLQDFGSIRGYLSMLLGLMLALFVSEIIARWWRCRVECLEALWASLADIILYLSVRCPSRDDAPMKEMVLRLCLLVHRLVYFEARGHEDHEHLQRLVEVGLLSEEELGYLVDEHGKSQIVLVWIGRIYHTLADKRHWKSDERLYLDERCRQARNASGRIFAYCHTQLPFQYVHLLSFCVLLSNLILCLKSGLLIGATLEYWRRFDHQGSGEPVRPQGDPALRVALQALQVVVEPLAYHAFLRLCSDLSNPFGQDFSDFPGFAYHCYMRGDSLSLQKAGENVPPGVLAVAAAVQESERSGRTTPRTPRSRTPPRTPRGVSPSRDVSGADAPSAA